MGVLKIRVGFKLKTGKSKLDIHQFYKGEKGTNIMFELIILVKTSITSDKLGTAEFANTIASLGDLSKQIEIAIEQSIQQYVADEYDSPIYEFKEKDVDLVGELLTWNEYNQGAWMIGPSVSSWIGPMIFRAVGLLSIGSKKIIFGIYGLGSYGPKVQTWTVSLTGLNKTKFGPKSRSTNSDRYSCLVGSAHP